jgi:hypothetical protein
MYERLGIEIGVPVQVADNVPVTTPIVEIPVEIIASVKVWKPIPMSWPRHWEIREEPDSMGQAVRLYMKPPGFGWIFVDLSVPNEDHIVMRVNPDGIFQNWQYGGLFLNLVTTYAHKFATRVAAERKTK